MLRLGFADVPGPGVIEDAIYDFDATETIRLSGFGLVPLPLTSVGSFPTSGSPGVIQTYQSGVDGILMLPNNQRIRLKNFNVALLTLANFAFVA